MIRTMLLLGGMFTTTAAFAGGVHCRECPAEDNKCTPRPSCNARKSFLDAPQRASVLSAGPLIPDGSYPISDCVRVGPACAGLIQDARLQQVQVNVRYDNGYANSVGVLPYGGTIVMEAMLNERPIDAQLIRGGSSRSGYEYQIVLPAEAHGDLAIFFRSYDGKNYDSDYGRNFHFTLQR